MQVNYAVIFVSDMSRSTAFYRDVLGLPLKFESLGWTEFATEGATLALHVSEEPNPHPGGSAKTPAGHCTPGFCVPDLSEFHSRMVGQNVPCLQGPRDVFGVQIAQYADPDGLSISVSQARAQG